MTNNRATDPRRNSRASRLRKLERNQIPTVTSRGDEAASLKEPECCHPKAANGAQCPQSELVPADPIPEENEAGSDRSGAARCRSLSRDRRWRSQDG